ncbi:MAG: alanine racemase [Sandaracinaceae bacterium]|nr:alanine racemase [Sandaracinaceae bacterium]
MAQPCRVQVRPTRAEIDRGALAHNLRAVEGRVGGAAVFAVIKADAYGHGLVPIAERLVREGVGGLAVALAEEGLQLRAKGIGGPILVLNGIYDGAHREVVEAGLTPVVYDEADAARFEALGAAVHVKVDTGMTRLGVRALGPFLDRFPGLRVAGLMTHLASADEDPEATRAQLDAFDAAIALARGRGHAPVLHAANSAGALLWPRARYDLVRVGVALYGVRPEGGDASLDLRPVMRVVTSVARVVEVPAGTRVGYGGTWTAARPSRVATLAIGYGDGYHRAASNRGHAVIRGVRCPLVGRVSMDLTGADVTDLPACERGDEAIMVGPELPAADVARATGTIAYEVLCSIAPRVPRVYLG